MTPNEHAVLAPVDGFVGSHANRSRCDDTEPSERGHFEGDGDEHDEKRAADCPLSKDAAGRSPEEADVSEQIERGSATERHSTEVVKACSRVTQSLLQREGEEHDSSDHRQVEV